VKQKAATRRAAMARAAFTVVSLPNARPVGSRKNSRWDGLILKGERSGLLTRIAETGNILLCGQTERLSPFLELEAAIRV
jgi:hypothetical protein